MTDRVIVWPGQIPLETDVLRSNKYAMIGIAKLAAAMLGTSTVVNGLACVPTTPAGLTVNVNPGEIYSLINIDGTAYSSVAADTTHSIMKSGILLDAVNLSCPAPGTTGQSINYLIQATYQDSDTDLVALPYYNASNPTQAWSGPNNSGTPQATTRKGVVTISAKAGTAATTGSQTTPAADSGYTGLWVVTVANGQSTITAGNIVQATNAPILPADLLHAVQASSLITGVDTGAANACVVNYTYPVTALSPTMPLWFKVKVANTGATTLNVNGLGAQPVVGGNHSALQGGELVANGKALVVWNETLSSFVLIECTGAAVQIAPATQSQHALQLGQAVGRLLNVQVLTSSGTYTRTPGATSGLVRIQGGGAGGSGSGVTGAGQVGIGPGGGSGAYGEHFFSGNLPASQAYTIGAGGSAGVISAGGGNGGTTVFGSLSAPGGGASPGPVVGAPPLLVGGNTATVVSSGCNLFNGNGKTGGYGIAISTGGFISGAGGDSPFGSGAYANVSGAAAGQSATSRGAGGAGGSAGASSSGFAGGAGQAGIIIVYEFA